MNRFTHENGKVSGTKTMWSLFAAVYLVRLVFDGLTLTIAGQEFAITFNGAEAAAVLGSTGLLYWARRHTDKGKGATAHRQGQGGDG